MTNLETFIQSYLITALWAPSLDEQSVDDFDPKVLASMEEVCAKFLTENDSLVIAEGKEFEPYGKYAMAGHDFWLSRNGHGAGFWDGDWPTSGAALDKKSEEYGEITLYVGDDGHIHLEG